MRCELARVVSPPRRSRPQRLPTRHRPVTRRLAFSNPAASSVRAREPPGIAPVRFEGAADVATILVARTAISKDRVDARSSCSRPSRGLRAGPRRSIAPMIGPPRTGVRIPRANDGPRARVLRSKLECLDRPSKYFIDGRSQLMLHHDGRSSSYHPRPLIRSTCRIMVHNSKLRPSGLIPIDSRSGEVDA